MRDALQFQYKTAIFTKNEKQPSKCRFKEKEIDIST